MLDAHKEAQPPWQQQKLCETQCTALPFQSQETGQLQLYFHRSIPAIHCYVCAIFIPTP